MSSSSSFDRSGPGRVSIPVLGLLFFLGLAGPSLAEASRARLAVGGAPAKIMPSPSPAASPSPLPSPSPSAVAPTPVDGAALTKELKNAQQSQLKALSHRQGLELREMKASHKARLKEWETREKALRRAFFKENPKGPDRRTYVQSFIARHKSFRADLADERAAKIKEHELRRQALLEDQAAKLKEFEQVLQRGERPPERLWPQPGS